MSVNGIRAGTGSFNSGQCAASKSLAAVWVGEHCHPRTRRLYSRCLACNGHVGGRRRFLLLPVIPWATRAVRSCRWHRRRRLSASMALQPSQRFYCDGGWCGSGVPVLLPSPVADSVDSLFNRYTVHSVVGPLFVLDSHACLRISNGIVLDRHRRVSYAGDIDPQNANRSDRRRRALRAGGDSASPGVQLCEAQSGAHRRFCDSCQSRHYCVEAAAYWLLRRRLSKLCGNRCS